MRSGKVRDLFEVGDRLLLVASDRMSAFDVVLPTPIPDKGRVLTGLSRFWFDRTYDIIPNHLVGTDPAELPAYLAGVEQYALYMLGKTDFDFFTEEHARQAFDDEQRLMRTGASLVGFEEKETWPDGRATWDEACDLVACGFVWRNYLEFRHEKTILTIMPYFRDLVMSNGFLEQRRLL